MSLKNHSKKEMYLDFNTFIIGIFICLSQKVELAVEMKVEGEIEI